MELSPGRARLNPLAILRGRLRGRHQDEVGSTASYASVLTDEHFEVLASGVTLDEVAGLNLTGPAAARS